MATEIFRQLNVLDVFPYIILISGDLGMGPWDLIYKEPETLFGLKNKRHAIYIQKKFHFHWWKPKNTYKYFFVLYLLECK